MTLHKRTQKQKLNSVMHLKHLTGGLPQETKFTAQEQRMKTAQMKNLSSALSRHIAEDGRVGFMLTLTFGKDARVNFQRMDDGEVMTLATRQYDSCMAFLHKMRKSKRIKGDIRYMATMELQSDGNLHMHIFLSVIETDMHGLLGFIYDFKRRFTTPYHHNNKEVYPIGRLHIGISQRYKKQMEARYTMSAHSAKSVEGKTEHYIASLESRTFQSGDWTPVEFYNETMIRERYDEKIVNYLTKTMSGDYALKESTVKEGVTKCQIEHDTKTLYDDDYITKLQLRFIRMLGKRVYTHSRLPFPFKLYQQYYKKLVAFDKNYTVYYNCIEAVRKGTLLLKGQNVIDTATGTVINRLDIGGTHANSK